MFPILVLAAGLLPAWASPARVAPSALVLAAWFAPTQETDSAGEQPAAGQDEAARWRRALVDHQTEESERVAAALKLLELDRPFVVSILERRDPEPAVLAVLRAVRIAAGEDPGVLEVVPAVLGCSARDGDIGREAVDTLVSLARAAPDAVLGELGKELEGDDLRRALAAVRVLERSGNLRAVPPLLEVLENEAAPEALKRAAARGLSTLLGLDFGTDAEKWRAFWATCAGKSRADILRAVLDEERRRWAEEIERKDREIVRLKREADGDDPAALIQDLDHELAGVRRMAAELLARGAEGWDVEPAREVVLRRLSAGGEPPDVEAAFLRLLARIDEKAGRNEPDAVRDALIARALLADDPQLVEAAVEAATAFPMAQVRDALRTALEKLPESGLPARVRSLLVKAAGRTGLAGAREALVRVLQSDPDVDVRVAAVGSLEALGDPETGPALAEALERDRDWRVRRRAATALARVGWEGARAALLEALDDERAEVRSEAATSLAKVGGEGVGRALLERFKAETDAAVRAAIARALGELGEEAALDVLADVAALSDAPEGEGGADEATRALAETALEAARKIAGEDEGRWLRLARRFEERGERKLAARARARRLELLEKKGAPVDALAEARIEAVRSALAAGDAATARRLAHEGLEKVDGMDPRQQARLGLLLGEALERLHEWLLAAAAYERALAGGGLDEPARHRAAVRRAFALLEANDPEAARKAFPQEPPPEGATEEDVKAWRELKARIEAQAGGTGAKGEEDGT